MNTIVIRKDSDCKKINIKNIKIYKNLKQEDGITIVALIVTIIVLLILASVSITIVNSNNGVINKTKQATLINKQAQIKECIKLQLSTFDIDEQTGQERITTKNEKQNVINELNEKGLITKDVEIVDDIIIVGNKYVVSLTTGDDAIEATDDMFYVSLDSSNIYSNYSNNDMIGNPSNEELENAKNNPNNSVYFPYTYTINEDGVNELTGVVYGYKGTEKNIIIPEYYKKDGIIYPITRIGNKWNNGFSSNSNMETLEIRNNIKIIEPWTFYNCSRLKILNMGDGVELLGTGAFENCKNLEEITISKSLIEISREAFAYDNSIRVIDIPENIKSIDKMAFMHIGDSSQSDGTGYVSAVKPKLEKIILHNGLEKIGEEAFSWSMAVPCDLNLPESVNAIGTNAFLRYGENNNKKVYNSDGTEFK